MLLLIKCLFVFLSTSILGGKVELEKPNSLFQMDTEMLGLKYPMMRQLPDVAFTDVAEEVNLLFSLSSSKLELADLAQTKAKMIRGMSKSQAITLWTHEIKTINNHPFIVVEFVSKAVDTDVYNLMFITSLDGKKLTGTFNCVIARLDEWQSQAQDILYSIKIKL